MKLLTWDNAHSAVLLIGVYVLVMVGIETKAAILPWIIHLMVWVIGYWLLVSLVLPERMQP